MDWRQPQRVDAEAREIIELALDAGEIADAVAVGVAEATRVDLIDDGAPPPGMHGPRALAFRLCPCARSHARRGRKPSPPPRSSRNCGRCRSGRETTADRSRRRSSC